MRLTTKLTFLYVRCPNCFTKLNLGSWNWWEWAGPTIGGLLVFVPALWIIDAFGFLPMILAVSVVVTAAYAFAAVAALTYGKLTAKEGCNEFQLPPM